MRQYRHPAKVETLCFDRKKEAEKMAAMTEEYYRDPVMSDRAEGIEVLYGTDERGNKGYYVRYYLVPKEKRNM